MACPKQADLTAVERAKIQQTFDKRGLPRAVDTRKPEKRALGDIEFDAPQNLGLPKTFVDFGKSNNRFCHTLLFCVDGPSHHSAKRVVIQ